MVSSSPLYRFQFSANRRVILRFFFLDELTIAWRQPRVDDALNGIMVLWWNFVIPWLSTRKRINYHAAICESVFRSKGEVPFSPSGSSDFDIEFFIHSFPVHVFSFAHLASIWKFILFFFENSSYSIPFVLSFPSFFLSQDSIRFRTLTHPFF